MENKERLEKLLREISREAEKEVDRIHDRAQSKVEELEEEFKDEKKKYMEKRKNKIDRSGALKKKQKVTRERLKQKKRILNRKRDLIEKVFDIAVEKLKNGDTDRKQKFFQKMLKETVNSGTEVVKPAEENPAFSESVIKKLNSENNWQLELGDSIKEQDGGFLLEGQNYETVVDWQSIKEYLKEKEEDRVISALLKKNND